MALSSIEIAGLLLANIPIFQEAANHDDAVSAADKGLAQKYTSRKLEEFYIIITYEFSLLRMSFEKLVSGLVDLPDREREALKSGDEEAWESARVATSVENRLGTGYHAFCAIFEKLHLSLEKIVQLKLTDRPVDEVCLPFSLSPLLCSLSSSALCLDIPPTPAPAHSARLTFDHSPIPKNWHPSCSACGEN